MKKKAKLDPNSRIFHVICPFCQTSTDYRTVWKWCNGCYTQFYETRSGNIWFDSELKRPEYALALAVRKSGGIRIGTIDKGVHS